MNAHSLPLLLLLAAGVSVAAQQDPGTAGDAFERAAVAAQLDLEQSLAELAALRERMAAETVPLSRQLADLESELVAARGDYQQATRLLDSRTLDLSNLRSEIKTRQDEATYLSNLLGEYIRNFESRLHITELQRYEQPLEAAKLALENTGLSDGEVFTAQSALLDVSLERLLDALGGTRFDGTAVDTSGLVNSGTFVLVGPTATFRSTDGRHVGTAEQRLGSLEPAVVGFTDPADSAAAERLVTTAGGLLPLDPTLGNAHQIAATEETLWEHIVAGGPVMVPIFVLAGAAFLVVLYKWLSVAFLRRPSQKQIDALLDAVGRHDDEAIEQRVAALKGPVGRMLAAGVEHRAEPKELIEEVMYETVLTTRLKLDHLLPFIAISASSAPLLGLLGTVTGIINTFKLITVYGSGDVKTLSSGISEALITTEYGLIVAIPSLLLHAFLSRKVRSVIGQMETAAVGLLNQIGRTSVAAAQAGGTGGSGAAGRAGVREQVRDALEDPLVLERLEADR